MALIKPILWTILVVMAGLILIEALRLLILKHDITTYKQYWEKRSAQAASPDSTLYIALGDSAAQGIGASKPEKGYVGLIASHIAKSSGGPVHVMNLSVTGAKIQDVIKDQLPQLQQISLPAGTVVTLDIGANDLAAFGAGTFSDSIGELFRQLPPQTVVADMPYFGGGRARNREADAVKASEVIHQLAAKYNLRVAPLHDTTKSNDSFWAYGADLFHPSDRGYQNWYRAFAAILGR